MILRACVVGTLVVLMAPVPAVAQRGGGRGRGAGAGAEPNEGRGGAGPSLKIQRDLEYVQVAGQPLRLDLYQMSPAAAPSPVLIWIHGTDVPGTTKITAPAIGLVRNGGVAVASIEYRTGPRVTVTDQLADLKAAVRWLKANAAAHNLDPARVAAIGYGTGGRLAALLGTTADVAALETVTNDAPSSRIQAAVVLAAPTASGATGGGGLNPVSYVTRDDAPTLLLHGTADDVVNTQDSQALVSALKVAGVATLLEMPMGVSHDLGALLSPLSMQSIDRFLSQHLLGAPGNAGLSNFVSTPPATYIDPVALDLGGTRYKLYPTAVRGPETFASYRVYLPPDYESNSTRRYPVIYFLHGRSVDSKRPITSGYVARVDAAIRRGVMPPTIVVIPQGLNTGWYLDAQDGQHPIESVIIKDLIPHVDATYRTMATRAGRAIEGHSMGGYGALHIGFKYPQLFAAVTGNSAALIHDVTDNMGTQEFWISQMPATLARANLATVRQQSIRIIIGEQDNLITGCRLLSKDLTSIGVRHDFIPVPGSPHNHDQLLQYQAFDTMAFYAQVFGRLAQRR